MPRGIPNKKEDMLKDIHDQVASVETGSVFVSKQPPAKVEGSNEFGDEYTMEVISDNEPGADMFRIPNKDPEFEYRFLRDDDDNMSVKTSNLLLQKGGWQVCGMKHLLRIGIDKKLLQPDGSYKVGKMYLAFMPKKLFAKKAAKDKQVRDEAMAGVQRLVDGGSPIKMQGVTGISKGTIKKGPLNYGSHNSLEE